MRRDVVRVCAVARSKRLAVDAPGFLRQKAPSRLPPRRGIVDALAGDGPAQRRIVTETDMLDVVLLASSVAFFLVSLAYVRGCEQL